MQCSKPGEHPFVPSAERCPECRRERQRAWAAKNRKARELMALLAQREVEQSGPPTWHEDD